MAIRQFFVITIELTGAATFMGNTQSDRIGVTRDIRLVESHTDVVRGFTLHDGDEPVYALSNDETERLLQLLGEIKVSAPWQGYAGFDGTDYELSLLGAMSSMTFRWWVKVPAEWDRVGDVFGYVLAIADRCQDEGI